MVQRELLGTPGSEGRVSGSQRASRRALRSGRLACVYVQVCRLITRPMRLSVHLSLLSPQVHSLSESALRSSGCGMSLSRGLGQRNALPCPAHTLARRPPGRHPNPGGKRGRHTGRRHRWETSAETWAETSADLCPRRHINALPWAPADPAQPPGRLRGCSSHVLELLRGSLYRQALSKARVPLTGIRFVP